MRHSRRLRQPAAAVAEAACCMAGGRSNEARSNRNYAGTWSRYVPSFCGRSWRDEARPGLRKTPAVRANLLRMASLCVDSISDPFVFTRAHSWFPRQRLRKKAAPTKLPPLSYWQSSTPAPHSLPPFILGHAGACPYQVITPPLASGRRGPDRKAARLLTQCPPFHSR